MNYLDIDFDDNEEDYYHYKKEKKIDKNKNSDRGRFEVINRKNNKQRHNNKRMLDDFFN